MQAIAQKVVMQAALIGSVSAGSYVFRKLKKTETNEFIANTVYLKENPELAQEIENKIRAIFFTNKTVEVEDIEDS